MKTVYWRINLNNFCFSRKDNNQHANMLGMAHILEKSMARMIKYENPFLITEEASSSTYLVNLFFAKMTF